MNSFELFGYCGVDCSSCTDYTDGKCPSCRKSVWDDGDCCAPISCCKEKNIPYCGACQSFPCKMMSEFYDESESDKRAYGLMLEKSSSVIKNIH